jgi:mRNA interferase YafQ
MYSIYISNQFKKDLKLLKKRSIADFTLLQNFIKKLAIDGFLGVDRKHKPHYLKGSYKDTCECHVLNDLLLLWREDTTRMTIELIRTGTHADLF